jgi:hypothetical protein
MISEPTPHLMILCHILVQSPTWWSSVMIFDLLSFLMILCHDLWNSSPPDDSVAWSLNYPYMMILWYDLWTILNLACSMIYPLLMILWHDIWAVQTGWSFGMISDLQYSTRSFQGMISDVTQLVDQLSWSLNTRPGDPLWWSLNYPHYHYLWLWTSSPPDSHCYEVSTNSTWCSLCHDL